MKKKQNIQPFRITWKNLVYRASRGSYLSDSYNKIVLKNDLTKTILNKVYGYFDSGQITGVMGPSGCGKSTLLSCISGQRKTGLSGSITLEPSQDIKFAFVVQENYILERLTVKESLIFASKLKNKRESDHQMIANYMIDKLMLNSCANTRANRCSGGQLKRVLIGLELVSKPNVLILDEPTSGLDSATTQHLIDTLIHVIKGKEPVAIMLTIHQPSAKVFKAFDKIYLLSRDGQSIYCGPPQDMNTTFQEYGLNCPSFFSIADFALEIASKEYGIERLSVLSTIVKIEVNKCKDNGSAIKRNRRYNTISDILVLTQRSLTTMVRNPYNLMFRIMNYTINAIFLSLLFGSESGQYSGCYNEFALEPGKDMMKKWAEVGLQIGNNFCLICFASYFAFIASIMPVLLTFPLEFNVFLQEYRNGYYSGFSYFMSKVLCELAVNLVLPNIGSLIMFFMTNQYWEQSWRLFNYLLIFILLSINGSALGFMISAAIPEYPTAVIFIGITMLFPQMLFSGISPPMHEMNSLFQMFTYLDNMRFAFEASVVNVYGFDRCSYGPEVNETDLLSLIPAEKLLEVFSSDKIDSEMLFKNIELMMGSSAYNSEDNISIIIRTLRLSDSNFQIGILMLILHFTVYYCISYVLIRIK